MKALYLICTLGATVFLSGCTSTKPSWSGIYPSEVQSWKITAVEQAPNLHFMGPDLASTHTREWFSVGIRSPKEIAGWHSAGFTANQALKWRMQGYNLQDAVKLTQ